MDRALLFVLGSWFGITGIVLLGAAIFCWAANRSAKLFEIALVDIGSMFVALHADRRSEHFSIASCACLRNLETEDCNSKLTKSTAYLHQIRATKIYLMRWAKRLAAVSTPVLAIAALIFGYRSLCL